MPDLNENCIERSKSISHIFNEKTSNIYRKNFNDTLKNRFRTRSISNLNNSITSRPKAFTWYFKLILKLNLKET